MGIDHKVMEEITPSIISFADIGAFIDAPMKTYSSGMRARVGFSIATAVDPDILLLDEVLQTGDNKFKQKSRRRIAEVLRSAKAVVMVTHDMSWITAFCTRAILLDRGRIVAVGDPVEIAEMHEESADARRKAERKQKRAIKRGAAPATNVRKARRERTIKELAVGVVGATAPAKPKRASAAGHRPWGSGTNGNAPAEGPKGPAVSRRRRGGARHRVVWLSAPRRRGRKLSREAALHHGLCVQRTSERPSEARKRFWRRMVCRAHETVPQARASVVPQREADIRPFGRPDARTTTQRCTGPDAVSVRLRGAGPASPRRALA